MKLEVLKFYADWCGPCKILSQRLEGEEHITNINIEKDHETAIKHNIRNIPTLIFFRDGVQVHRTTGLITKHEYDNIIDEIKIDKDVANIEVTAEVVEPKQDGDGDND